MRYIIKIFITLFLKFKYKVSVFGYENLPRDTGYILCSNHINLQDPLVIGISLPFYIRYMAKKELFDNKLLGFFLKYAGGFPVDRDGNDLKAIKTALKILKSGGQLLIFAEGTRNKSLEPLKAKPGVAMMAIKSKVPIVPVTVDSNYKLFSKVNITFQEPVYLEQYYG